MDNIISLTWPDHFFRFLCGGGKETISHTVYVAGLKPGWVISSGSTGSSFIPDQVGQIWFINYLGLTQILIWITRNNNAIWS